MTGDCNVVGIRIPARPVLSLLGAGGKGTVLLKDCLREMHYDHCAVSAARLHLSFMLQVRGLLRSLHERVATLMDSFMTPLRGTHPSATVRVGVMLDEDLQTEVNGLYVCDASLFPEALDRPTVLTIIGLSKRLARQLLAQDQFVPAGSTVE